MIIAIVDFHVAPVDRDRAVEVLRTDGAAALAIPSNRGFRVFANVGDPSHVGLMHEWTDEKAITAYLSSDGFAEVGAVLRPMMTAPPVSRRFDATLVPPSG